MTCIYSFSKGIRARARPAVGEAAPRAPRSPAARAARLAHCAQPAAAGGARARAALFLGLVRAPERGLPRRSRRSPRAPLATRRRRLGPSRRPPPAALGLFQMIHILVCSFDLRTISPQFLIFSFVSHSGPLVQSVSVA